MCQETEIQYQDRMKTESLEQVLVDLYVEQGFDIDEAKAFAALVRNGGDHE